MAYIGQKPADKPLGASDITDGIISNAKLAQDIISAETELAEAPASTDEFLISDAGSLKRIDASLVVGGGKILQVVSSGVIDQTYSSNATSYTAVTSHSLAITPSSTSSKVFMMFSFNARSSGTANTTFTLYRGATNLNANGFTTLHDDNASADTEVQCTLTFLDSPSTTSATTFALYGKSADSGDSFRVNTKGSDSVITLFEVGS